MIGNGNHTPPVLGKILSDYDRVGPEYAFVECYEPGCKSTGRIDHSAGVSDAELTRQFNALGWSIKPTRCPEHSTLKAARP